MRAVADENERIRFLPSTYPRGFGFTVRYGLDNFTGDAVALVMADGSDAPGDLVSYLRLLEAGDDCAFGRASSAGLRCTAIRSRSSS